MTGFWAHLVGWMFQLEKLEEDEIPIWPAFHLQMSGPTVLDGPSMTFGEIEKNRWPGVVIRPDPMSWCNLAANLGFSRWTAMCWCRSGEEMVMKQSSLIQKIWLLDTFFGKTWNDTPPKFNIALEKWWLENDIPFGMADFEGRTVKLPGSIPYIRVLYNFWLPGWSSARNLLRKVFDGNLLWSKTLILGSGLNKKKHVPHWDPIFLNFPNLSHRSKWL